MSTSLAARLAGSLLLGALCLTSTGCVQRRLTIRTNPPGAAVFIDDYEIGTTPVSTSYVYYGTRKVRLVRDGYETQTFLQRIPTPWWDIFPLDFVVENVIPFEIRDERTIERDLQPQGIVPTEVLIRRAEELRSTVHVPTGVAQRPDALPGAGPEVVPRPPADLGPGQIERLPSPP
jgi:hypothetical protein